jgi:hypothetical protein
MREVVSDLLFNFFFELDPTPKGLFKFFLGGGVGSGRLLVHMCSNYLLIAYWAIETQQQQKLDFKIHI